MKIITTEITTHYHVEFDEEEEVLLQRVGIMPPLPPFPPYAKPHRARRLSVEDMDKTLAVLTQEKEKKRREASR